MPNEVEAKTSGLITANGSQIDEIVESVARDLRIALTSLTSDLHNYNIDFQVFCIPNAWAILKTESVA